MIASTVCWQESEYSRPRSRVVDFLLVDIFPTLVMFLVMAFAMSLVADATESSRSAAVHTAQISQPLYR